ncbi:MBOAT family O-acyltransferase [Candidatus Agathobaculum pullicola]|uniref:MBOAT family O-acyltransferase n=1 Tax=Candidatus Agathobaculum pullicola TaxID=2838426 RepID=UPI003F938458
MSFASLAFLFIFLPAVLVGYYCFPRRWRNLFLLAANLVFYGWGEPWFLPIILLTAVANWMIGRRISACAQAGFRRLWLIAALILDLGLLLVFKYAGFLLDAIGLGQVLVKPLPLPLGISFYTFQVVSYVIDVYRKTSCAEKNIVSFATYMTFFPQLIAGPIVRYEELSGQLAGREETWNKIANGFCLLMIGLGKKMLLANPMGQLWDGLRALPNSIGMLGAWMGAVAFTMQIYFDFSGYSDMARGLGGMFGFDIPVNFRYPYAAQSIKEFWRRWHITLSRWFRDYVYIPLGGSRRGSVRTFVNLLVVWALTGLWHGAAWNYVLWGLYYFALLSAERLIGEARLARIPRALRHVLTMALVVLGWVLFAIEDFGTLADYLHAMFSLSGGLISAQAAVWVLSYLPLLCVATLASLSLAARLVQRYEEDCWVRWSAPVWCLLLLAASCAALVAQSYNPFLYFRF